MSTLKADIDRGLAIVGQIAELEKELKAIEGRIREHATTHPEQHQPLTEADREGRQFLANGTDLIVPVVFTADKLVGSFQQGSKEHQRIGRAVPEDRFDAIFDAFFKPWHCFENRFGDGHAFRRRAAELLGEHAPAFITACKVVDKFGMPKSDVKIEWKQAAAAAKLESLAKNAPGEPLVPGATTPGVAA